MSRVRQISNNRRTAVAYDNKGSGCLSFYALTPISVLFLGILISLVVNLFPPQTTSLVTSNSSLSDRLAPLFTLEVQYWSTAILRWGEASKLDPNLVATVMQIESCGDTFARSSAGAAGLFQVMPYHFDSNDNPFDPDTNALRGLTYLRHVFDASSHNIEWSLAAYNGGPSLIGLNERIWPAETTRYVFWGSGIYADASHMQPTSQRLNEWLDAGGASLCRKAHQQLNLPK
jgi:soluble lytic murein transglycosylase-like protein